MTWSKSLFLSGPHCLPHVHRRQFSYTLRLCQVTDRNETFCCLWGLVYSQDTGRTFLLVKEGAQAFPARTMVVPISSHGKHSRPLAVSPEGKAKSPARVLHRSSQARERWGFHFVGGGSHTVAQAGLGSRPSCLSPPSAGIMRVCPHACLVG